MVCCQSAPYFSVLGSGDYFAYTEGRKFLFILPVELKEGLYVRCSEVLAYGRVLHKRQHRPTL